MTSPYDAGLQTAYGPPETKPAPAPLPYDKQPPAKSCVWLALLGGHLGAAAYFAIALGILIVVVFAAADAPAEKGAVATAVMFGILAAAYGALGIVAEVVTIGMHLRHKWAWFAGLAMLAFYLLSLFLPIGALGMCGLLMPGSRRDFGIG